MFSSFERTIAFRYLRSGKKEGIISVIAGFSLLGVALGVAALIVVMAVMNGFHKEISAKMTGFNGDIEVTNLLGSITDYDSIVAKIKAIEEVTVVTPLVKGEVMATARNFSSGALVKGIKLEDLKDRALIAGNIIEGNIDNFIGSNVLVGKLLADNLRLYLDEPITLISPSGNNTVIGMVPRLKIFTAGSFFKTDMYLYDNTTIFMPLPMAQIYFKMKDKVNLIEIMLTDPNKSELVVSKIAAILTEDFRVNDWKTLNASYFNVLKTERVVMFSILTLIILVAAFNIISSLIMLVKDKTKDIAILRTMGATRNSILRIFFLCGSVIGLSGTFLGIALGLTFALNIERIKKFLETVTSATIFDPLVYYLSALPADVEFYDVASIGLLATCLSLLATIYPARKAAKTEPVEGLRYE